MSRIAEEKMPECEMKIPDVATVTLTAMGLSESGICAVMKLEDWDLTRVLQLIFHNPGVVRKAITDSGGSCAGQFERHRLVLMGRHPALTEREDQVERLRTHMKTLGLSSDRVQEALLTQKTNLVDLAKLFQFKTQLVARDQTPYTTRKFQNFLALAFAEVASEKNPQLRVAKLKSAHVEFRLRVTAMREKEEEINARSGLCYQTRRFMLESLYDEF